MKFDDALKLLRRGVKMTRLVWEDPKQYVKLKEGIFRKEMKMHGKYKVGGKYKYVSLACTFSHEDLLAKDWEITRQ